MYKFIFKALLVCCMKLKDLFDNLTNAATVK